MLASVLVYGDSLTWGSRPDGRGRHPAQDRWPNVLAAGLTGVDVIAEGLRGRTTAHQTGDSPGNPDGAAVLPTVLHSHSPVDLVVVMLGANDVYFGFGAERAGMGLRRIIEIILGHPWRIDGVTAPEILLVAPPQMVPSDDGDVTEAMIVESLRLPEIIRATAKSFGTGYFNAGSVAKCASRDGVHLDAENTKAIGSAVVAPIQAMLRDREGSRADERII